MLNNCVEGGPPSYRCFADEKFEGTAEVWPLLVKVRPIKVAFLIPPTPCPRSRRSLQIPLGIPIFERGDGSFPGLRLELHGYPSTAT